MFTSEYDSVFDDDYFSYYPDDDDPPDEEDFDCGWVPGYGCQMAGTEDCNFDCPYYDYYHNNVETSKTTN